MTTRQRGTIEATGSPALPAGVVVAAVDFSPASDAALAWAGILARAYGDDLVLVHAVEQEPSTDGLHAEIDRRVRVARSRDLAVVGAVIPGQASTAVVAAAARRGADAIVVGTRGRHALERALLGSTAAAVVRDAGCPVLTVHAHDAVPSGGVRRVVVGIDFSEDATAAAHAARRLVRADAAGARVVLVHVHVPAYESRLLPGDALCEELRRGMRDARRRLRALAPTLRGEGIRVATRVVAGYPPDALVAVARGLRADVLALGTHGQSRLDRLLVGSTAQHVLPLAPCPVLTARAGAGGAPAIATPGRVR